MVDILLPPWLGQARTRIRYLDNTGISRSPYNGITKTATFGGDRLAATVEFVPQGNESAKTERAALMAFLAKLRGKQNRAYLFDHGNRLRGSFPATEVLTNGTFSNGTTGFSSGSFTLTSSDRILRGTVNSSLSAGNGITTGNVTVTQYAPYVARWFVSGGNLPSTVGATLRDSSSNVLINATASSGPGMRMTSYVPFETAMRVDLRVSTSGNAIAGQYLDVSYASLSRCALADNGVNLLLASDEFSNANWTKTRCSVTGNVTAAPNGTSTADSIVEDSTASNTHFVSQAISIASTANLDYCFAIALKAGARTWARCRLRHAGGNIGVSLNLATGALGSTTIVGTGWADARSFSQSLGDGWYYLCIVARKTTTETTLNVDVFIADDTGTITYNGDGSSNIYAWRGTLAQSSVPVRLVQTTAAATSGDSPTGSAMYVKGLPVSTNGLLLPGDQVEITTSRGPELKFVMSALNSDAAGLGYLEFEPPLRGSPANDAPIIVLNPMGRFVFRGDFPEWATDPGPVTSASAEFEEA